MRVRGFKLVVERTNILTVMVLVFDEEEALPLCRERLAEVLERGGRPYALPFVNDGSSDRSVGLLNRFAAGNVRIRVLHFSRNFGHEAAMIIGIDYTEGNAIRMGTGLQHPPQRIPETVWAFNKGFDVTSMVRIANRSAGLIKNITSIGSHGVMNALNDTGFEENTSDFFDISVCAAEVLRHDYRERVRFLRDYMQSLGFRSTILSYEAAGRAAGRSRYSIWKLFRFLVDMTMSSSDLPLRLGIYMRTAPDALSVLLLLYSTFTKLRFGVPDGYTTITVAIYSMFSMLFPILGIMGQYINVPFQGVKGYPICIVAAGYGTRAAEYGVLTGRETEA